MKREPQKEHQNKSIHFSSDSGIIKHYFSTILYNQTKMCCDSHYEKVVTFTMDNSNMSLTIIEDTQTMFSTCLLCCRLSSIVLSIGLPFHSLKQYFKYITKINFALI